MVHYSPILKNMGSIRIEGLAETTFARVKKTARSSPSSHKIKDIVRTMNNLSTVAALLLINACGFAGFSAAAAANRDADDAYPSIKRGVRWRPPAADGVLFHDTPPTKGDSKGDENKSNGRSSGGNNDQGSKCRPPTGPTEKDRAEISKLVVRLRALKAEGLIGNETDDETSTHPPPISPADRNNTVVNHPAFKLADVITNMTHAFCVESSPNATRAFAVRNARNAILKAREAETILSSPDTPDEAKALGALAEAVRFEGMAAGRHCDPPDTSSSISNQKDLASVASDVANLTVYRLERAINGTRSDPELSRLTRNLKSLLIKANGLFNSNDYDSGFETLEGILGGGGGFVFSYEEFETNIRNKLASDEIAGYAYAISASGQLWSSDAEGMARMSKDGNAKEHSPTKKMNIASLSKTITAVTMLRLLRDTPGVTLDSVIGPYLPPGWDLYFVSAQLTFRELMQQRSGMWGDQVASSTDFQSMQNYLFLLTDGENWQYENANFGIFRIVLPYLWGILPQTFGQDLDVITAAIYIYYVQTYMFEPIGIIGADCNDPGPDRTLQYTNKSAGFFSYDPGDDSLICGGGGWYTSAVDMANFLAHVRFDDNYLNPSDRLVMDEEYLGWMDASVYAPIFNGDWGIYRGHGGDLRNANGGNPRWSEIHTCHINFPNGAQAVLFVNSPLVSIFKGPLEYQCKLLANAYDGAWTWIP